MDALGTEEICCGKFYMHYAKYLFTIQLNIDVYKQINKHCITIFGGQIERHYLLAFHTDGNQENCVEQCSFCI